MSCRGWVADYLCAGWRERTSAIRKRDGNRCRGCNRSEDDIRLEVHHRVYGSPGSCGQCYLTGVSDDDLMTLCVDCHDCITDVRRRVRYGSNVPIEVTFIAERAATEAVALVRSAIPIEFVPTRTGPVIAIRRTASDILGKV